MRHCSLIPLHSFIMDGNYPSNMDMSDHNSSSTSIFGPSYSQQSNFEGSEFFEFDDWMEDDQTFMTSGYTTTQSPRQEVGQFINSSGSSSQQHANVVYDNTREGGSSGRGRRENREKVAFKTKSEVEILDDGFKWRKYGKKMVKNSPNPRNYYRCSVEGCPVKKRVERDREDPRYVITTYEGIHNHQGPPHF